MPTNTYVALDKVTVSGTSTNNVTFTSIPSTYTDLVIVINSSKTSGGATNAYLRFNNDSGSNYSSTFMYGTGSSAGSGRTTSTVWTLIGDQTTDMSQITAQIMNYANTTTYKTQISRYSNAAEAVLASVGLWQSTAAINRVDVYLTAGTYFSSGSTISLYGIKAWADETTPKATGGYVYEDSTYWYHAFPFSGTFTPNQSLSCDVLVVAGGGGGSGFGGGGGGAGGLIYGTGKSFSATSYTVTVGSGGARATNNGADGSYGTNSVINGWTAIGGGAGAHITTGGTGGSGGGGGYNTQNGGGTSQTSPAGATGYGNPGGGNTGTGAPNYPAGGGGGAGGAGGTQTGAANSAAGGIGRQYIDFATATGTGVNGYYAGGGGGSANTSSGSTGGLGGGGNGIYYPGDTPGNDAVASTGGGGGGGGNAAKVAGSGGSGIVIVRYAKV